MNEQHKAFLQIILENKDKVEQKIKENLNFITEIFQHISFLLIPLLMFWMLVQL